MLLTEVQIAVVMNVSRNRFRVRVSFSMVI